MTDLAVQSNTNFGPGDTSFASDITGGNTLVAAICDFGGADQTVASSIGGGTPVDWGTSLGTCVDPTNGRLLQIFALFGAGAGPTVVTSTGNFSTITIVEGPPCSGLRVANSNSETVGTVNPNVLLTGTVLGDWCILMANANNGGYPQDPGSCGTNPNYTCASIFGDLVTFNGESSGGTITTDSDSSSGPPPYWSAVAVALITGGAPPATPTDSLFFGCGTTS